MSVYALMNQVQALGAEVSSLADKDSLMAPLLASHIDGRARFFFLVFFCLFPLLIPPLLLLAHGALARLTQ